MSQLLPSRRALITATALLAAAVVGHAAEPPISIILDTDMGDASRYPPLANGKEAEWNFKQDPASAALVCSTWPTPMLFSGEGGSTCSGRRVTYETVTPSTLPDGWSYHELNTPPIPGAVSVVCLGRWRDLG